MLQIAAIAAVVISATTLAANVSHDSVQKAIVILVGIAAYFTIRKSGDGLRTWLDRRFFRENYNAENVLSELSEHVRSIVEIKPLLETVAARISETLHVPQVAVLLGGGGFYRPAFAMGYDTLPIVTFPTKTGTAMVLKNQKEPARVFLNDRDSWVYREDSISEEERGKLATLRSELLLPLAVRDKLLGFISLGPKRSEEPYTFSDVRLLKSVAAQTGLALENASLMQTVADEVAIGSATAKSKLPARYKSGSSRKNCHPSAASIMQVIAALRWEWAAITTASLPASWTVGHRHWRCVGQRNCCCTDDGQPAASLRSGRRAPESLAARWGTSIDWCTRASSSNRYATFSTGNIVPPREGSITSTRVTTPPCCFTGGTATIRSFAWNPEVRWLVFGGCSSMCRVECSCVQATFWWRLPTRHQ